MCTGMFQLRQKYPIDVAFHLAVAASDREVERE